MSEFTSAGLVLATILLGGNGAQGGANLPEGFQITDAATGFVKPVDIEFAADGRMFVAEQRGMIWVVENGVRLPSPFIDLREEVNGQWDRGLLGIALDADFLNTRRVYCLYTVDPIFGAPDEDPFIGTFCRLTQYTGTVASSGNVADPATRCVMLGATPIEGIPTCEPSHTIGTVRIGLDGSVLVGAGDGANFGSPDPGGQDPECFVEGMFGDDEDIGAFRSQYLGSLAGKILRLDPETGEGLPSNPYWTGSGDDKQSKVWAYGVRNPFRFNIRPGTGGPDHPGTLYIGDVGWGTWEEIDVAHGGENFGWPCYEGFHDTSYQNENPDHSGCDSIETPPNPGPLTSPLMDWHHTNPALSNPPGFDGRCVVAGGFYEGTCYPELYQGAFFFMGQRDDWIKVLVLDDDDNLVSIHNFATGVGGPVDLEADPLSGDFHVVNVDEGRIQRMTFGATLVDHDFETDPGYSVENIELTGGGWDRGVPAGGGDRGDPPTDFDGSGQCWLTQNLDGDSDVDGGPTRLTTPAFDLTGADDPGVGYARWFTNDDLDEDRLEVHVSDDDGATWVLVESVGHNDAWQTHTFRLTDYVAQTATVRLRFSAQDNPNNSVTEAAIDAFRIVNFVCTVENCPGDFNDDDEVGFSDLLEVLAAWGPCVGCPQDLDGDDVVGFADLLATLANWGPCAP